MNPQQTVNNIYRMAQKTTDPDRLREYVIDLKRWSAWEYAEIVEKKQKEAERRLAEEVNR